MATSSRAIHSSTPALRHLPPPAAAVAPTVGSPVRAVLDSAHVQRSAYRPAVCRLTPTSALHHLAASCCPPQVLVMTPFEPLRPWVYW